MLFTDIFHLGGSFYTVLAASSALAVIYYVAIHHTHKARLPPGPKGWPIIGNTLQMPKKNPWLKFSEWKRIYGDIIHVDVSGRPIIIINSLKIAQELLDKRSTIYSDRPRLEMATLVGYDRNFSMAPYGQEWRQQRKYVAQALSAMNCPRYRPIQEKGAMRLVQNILDDSSRIGSQIRFQIGAIVLRTAYGYSVASKDDPVLRTVSQMMKEFGIATTPGMFLVDFIPALRYIPTWLPGAGFKRTADKWRANYESASLGTAQWSKQHLETGSGKALTPNIYENIHNSSGSGTINEKDDVQIAHALTGVLGGGLDTNISTTLTFFMAMILNPSVQKKAQAELAAVVGNERLPRISDMHNLPYIKSIMAEVYRWGPAVPLAVPHAPNQDDEYNGLFIPKGSIVLANSWHMLHDPEWYPNPMEFTPERYNGQDDEMEKVKNVAFGFGRRFCPGFHFAEGTFFAIASITLATCDILPGLDENGVEVLPQYLFTSGTISFPEAFPLRVRARSPQASALLAESLSRSAE
ncbi:hypothetical protein CVT24_002899 [Panaeolus cyanescens]|uniref:Cytochrome P450 n=1 Tax=Panaeolus cyanescens TaxID=181874 RepID=A0A409W8P0_9AGAR|nr:hypothetical protein CVT24_002899 [Panaeolus cyanescens]